MPHKTLKEIYDDLKIKPRIGDLLVIASQSFTIVDQHHNYFKAGGEWHHFSDDFDAWNITVLDELYRDGNKLYPKPKRTKIMDVLLSLKMTFDNAGELAFTDDIVDLIEQLIDLKIKEFK